MALTLLLGPVCWTTVRARDEGLSRRNLHLDVLLDGQATGLIGTFRQDPRGGISADPKELEDLGIKVPPELTRAADVALTAIPGVTVAYDEASQRIDIKLPSSARLPKHYDVQPSAHPSSSPERAGTGLVMNYSLYGASQDEQLRGLWNASHLSATIDARVFSPVGVVTQSGVLSRHALSGSGAEALRLDTTWTYSDPGSLVTYRAGDLISSGVAWTRPIRIGGFQTQRNFGLRPDLITLPLPSFAGSAAVPSTVDILVNGARTATQDVSTGPFRINNIPILSGNGNASVIIRDPSGRQSETTLPFVVSSQLLRAGLLDYSAEIGRPRLHYGLRSGEYGDGVVGSTSARYGVSDALTVIGHAEVAEGFGMTSAGAVFGLGSYGVFTAAGAGSIRGGHLGGQSYLSFETQLQGLSFLAASQRSYGDYQDLASISGEPLSNAPGGLIDYLAAPSAANKHNWGKSLLPPRALDRVSLGLPIPQLGGSASLGFTAVRSAVGRANRVVTASYTRPLWGGGSFYATVFTDLADRQASGIFAGLSFPLDAATTSSVGATQGRSRWSLAAEVAKPIGQQAGSFGWRVRDVEGERGQKRRSAAVSYRGDAGLVEAGIGHDVSGVSGTVQFDGAIAVAGGSVFLANRIDDAFAVAKVGAPGVDVLFENRVVARTNRSGDALIPSLRAYQANKISIDPRGLPLDAVSDKTVEIRAPSDRAGVVIDFGVRSTSHSAVVILEDASGRSIQPGATGALQAGLKGADVSGPGFTVGYDGRAYIENLSSDNEVVVQLPDRACRARFPFSPRADAQVSIGPVRCL